MTEATADNKYLFKTTAVNDLVYPTSNLFMNQQGITNMRDPESPGDAATKAYVDSLPVFRHAKVTIGLLQQTDGTSAVSGIQGFV